jgi:hypothetical protein
MSKGQVIFAIITACIAVASLIWTAFWAMRIWRKAGDDVTFRLARGVVDNLGVLRVRFINGEQIVTTVEDPWGKRDQKPKRSRDKTREPPKIVTQPVNAHFLQNRGRAAVTVKRCRYFSILGEDIAFSFEPQKHSSPWGDLVPKRLDPGEEIIVVHETDQMRLLWNGVLRDHGVQQTVYGVLFELGNGKEVYSDCSVVVRIDMADEEFEEALRTKAVLQRTEIDEPEPIIVRPRKRFKYFGKDQRQAVIMRSDMDDSPP